MRGQGRRGERGFTLIEVIIVLAILSVILGMLAPFAFQLFSSERSTATEDELQAIYRAIVGDPGNGFFGYVGDVGKYPASLRDLMVQPTDPATGNKLEGWKGPYLQNPRMETDVILDPFGRPFEYLLKAVADGVGNQFAIISRGADGVSTNTATNPNIADGYVDPVPTDPAYAAAAQNTDNVLFPRAVNATALDKIVSGDVALNILNFDANPKVNAFVPACPQLFNVTATSVVRGTEEENLTYAQGVTFDLFQGQYRIKVSPQPLTPGGTQTTVSWTETATVLPASTLTRTLNLTGLDSSATQQFILTVKNSFTNTEVEIFEFTDELSGAALTSTSYNQGSLKAGVTQKYVVHGCAQVYIRNKTGSTVLDQLVMPYGDFTRIVGANPATLTVENRVEKKLKVFRYNVLIGTVPRGDVHDDEGQKHPHIKTRTFKDLTIGDVIYIYSVKGQVSTLLTPGGLTLSAPSTTVTLQ